MVNFKKIGDARSDGAANYFRAGHYLVRVNGLTLGTNHKNIDFVQCPCTILHVYPDTNAAGVQDPKTKQTVLPHKVGEEALQKMMSDKESFLGNVKHVICRCTGASDDQVGEMETLIALNEDANKKLPDGSPMPVQPLAGMLMEVYAAIKTSPKTGNTYTAVTFVKPVAASEVKRLVDPKVLGQFVPNIAQLIAAEGVTA